MHRTNLTLCTTLFLAVVTVSAPVAAQKRAKQGEKEKAANLPAVIWRDQGDIRALNLFYGAGGKEHAPGPRGEYTFVKEDMKGTIPKFDVVDEQGVRWRVKLEEEAQAETAATRLVWAAGYFVDEDYYLGEIKVAGLPQLRRGRKYVSPDGTVHGGRLKRRMKEIKKLESWDWFHNPFLGTKELNGLRVMMAILNNWDCKTINNSIYEVDGERRYVVSDLDATFGKTGHEFSRSVGVVKDYAGSKFIEKLTPDAVDFALHSRPFFVMIFDVHYYTARTRMEKIAKHIPRADAKWLGERLAQLSEEQIHDCFRAAGYTPEEVEGFTRAVQKRIADLNAL